MPDEYASIKRQIDEKKKEREKYIENRIAEINESLKEQKIVIIFSLVSLLLSLIAFAGFITYLK